MTIKWAIDTSLWDGYLVDGTPVTVDWDASGLDMAIIKSSQGTSLDPIFEAQWRAAEKLPRAAYHYFDCRINPEAQAEFCWSVLSKNRFNSRDYVLLDFERTDGRPVSEVLGLARRWLYAMKSHMTNHPPMIYTYSAFWKSVGGETALWATEFPLALAQWPKDLWVLGFPINVFDPPKFLVLKGTVANGSLKPAELKPWTGLPAIWQFTARCAKANIPGYCANKAVVDYDAIFMDLEQAPISVCQACGQEIKEKCNVCGQNLPEKTQLG